MLTTIPSIEAELYGIGLSLLSCLTLLGNILVCASFCRFRNLRNLTNYLVCSLACADLLVPLLREIYIAISGFKGEWVFGMTWCELSSMCGVLLCGASILHLSAISIERLIAIKWPLSYDITVTPKRILILLVYIWTQSFVLSIFPALGLAEYHFSPVLAECEIDWLKNPILTVLLTVFYFFAPVVIMFVAYALIFQEVRRNSQRISAIEHTGNRNFLRSRGMFKRDMKAVKTLAVVIGIFFLMWMPYFVTTTMRAFKGNSFVPGTLLRTVIVLAYGNSCCNFVIYAFMNRQLRNAFCQVLSRCKNHTKIDLHSARALQMTAAIKPAKHLSSSENVNRYHKQTSVENT